MSTPWRLLALDFDGVIADSMPLQEQAWRQAVRQVVGKPDVERRIVENLYSGHAGPRMFAGLALSDDELSNLRATKDELWIATRRSTPTFAGIGVALPALASSCLVAVATTADLGYVTSILERESLSGSIAAIITDKDVPRPKPAADMLLSLMRRFQVDARDTCMVGDSRTDYEMSRAAQVHFIRFASHDGASDVPAPFVDNWADLVDLLQLPPSPFQ